MSHWKSSRSNESSPPLYKSNLPARQTELTIFVFANGDELNCNSAKRFDLCKFDLLAWDPTLDVIAMKMGLHKKGIKMLYTRGGRRIKGSWELRHGSCYIGVGPHERFRRLDYGDPKCELFQRIIKAKRHVDRETKLQVGNRDAAPFYSPTPTYNHQTNQGFPRHCHQCLNSLVQRTSQNNVYKKVKPSRSVQQLHHICNTNSHGRHISSSVIPYDKNIQGKWRTQSNCELNSSQSTPKKIKFFLSKYVPTYSECQENSLCNSCTSQSCVNQSTVQINTIVSPKPRSLGVQTSVDMSACSTISLHSRVSKFTDLNVPTTNVPSDNSLCCFSGVSKALHTNRPKNDSSQNSLHFASTRFQTLHTYMNTLTDVPSTDAKHSSFGRSQHTPIHATTYNYINHSSSISQASYANTRTNMSTYPSMSCKSSRCQSIPRDSLNYSSRIPVFFHATQVGCGYDKSVDLTHGPSLKYQLHTSTRRPPLQTSRNLLENDSLTCVSIRKPDVNERVVHVRSVPYFLDLHSREEHSKGLKFKSSLNYCQVYEQNDKISNHQPEGIDTYMIENDMEEEEIGKCRPLGPLEIWQGWCSKPPSTTGMECPEETEETAVDYWFLSEVELEDDLHNDTKGLKMEFIELD